MKIEYFWITLLFALIGYLFGSISWAIILTKFKGKDVRKLGSKNAGATNVLRSYGKNIALIVLLLDMLKAVVPTIIVYFISRFAGDPWNSGLIQIVPLSSLIGHVYPIFFGFKGGKGATTFIGIILVTQWVSLIIGMITFLLIVKKTKKASIGSLIGPLVIIIFNIIFLFVPEMNNNWSNPIMQKPYIWVSTIVLIVAWLFIVFFHKDNIKRLLQGNERKIK